MHVLFVHPNYPAQFGHLARHLCDRHGWRCTFVTERVGGPDGPVERIQYRLKSGATEKNHYCTRTFENATWHAHAVFEALKARPDVRPDLIVGHSGFGTTLFLRELYGDTPIVNYFEYFYHAANSDMDFRPDFPTTELDRLRARCRNAMILLDLDNCDRGYSPTAWQRGRFPAEYVSKIEVAFDGIDTNIWKPRDDLVQRIGDCAIPEGMKVVTYATRGMESMRGFDIFMKFAKKLAARRSDVLFLIAGEDRVCYGGDERVTGMKSFKDWVLKKDEFDLSRFRFLGRLPPTELAALFARSDLHVYLTVPFVLSWSLVNALACGSLVLASGTDPVREVIGHGRNGLLADFFDVDAFVAEAERVLTSPADYTPLRTAAVATVAERYSLDVCLPRLRHLFEATANRGRPESG